MPTIAASYDLDKNGAPPGHGLCLLFAEGNRPDREAIREFVRLQQKVSISFDPAARPNLRLVAEEGDAINQDDSGNERGSDWLELLCAGLTFDLEGFSPGAPIRTLDVDHSFDFDGKPPPSQMEALRLVPGRHLSGGEASLPVIGAMLELARELIQHFDTLEGAVWPPSSSVIGRRFFESTVTAWLGGGAFPALGLTAFQETFDGALQSVGLSYFIEQELRIEPSLAADKIAATRLGIRLVNQLIILGRLTHEEQVVAPDGSRLALVPSKNGKFIRVQPA